MTGSVLFRCDAGADIGGGHVLRCLALAQALAGEGWQCAFAARPGTRDAVPGIAAFPILPLDGDAAAEADAIASQADGDIDILVVDHYRRGADFEEQCRSFATHVAALDDAPNRDHACDTLICPTPPWTAADFATCVGTGTRILTGPHYAPLRDLFARRRFDPTARADGTPGYAWQRLLVSFGATDPADATGFVLDALTQAGLTATCAVDVMLGAGAPHRAAVSDRAATNGAIRLHVEPDDPAALMAAADLAIGAAGTMAWERCTLGLPAILIGIAANQRPGAACLAARGAAIDLGPLDATDAATLVDALHGLLGDAGARHAMAAAAASLCDGLGAQRIAAALAPPRASDGRPVFLRPATLHDSATILAWQSHPETRRFSRNPDAPDAQAHDAWMKCTMVDPQRVLSIVLHGDAPAGLVRLDRQSADDAGAESFEVSILIAPEHKQRGLATIALDLAHRLRPTATLLAHVQAANDASHALFRRAGYTACDNGYRHPPRRSLATGAMPS